MNHVKLKCVIGYQNCEECNHDSHPEIFTCEICLASEGELTRDCPGIRLSQNLRKMSYDGQIDFLDGSFLILSPLTDEEYEELGKYRWMAALMDGWTNFDIRIK